MKKFKIILALLLALAVMFTFFGCAEQEDGHKDRKKDTGIVGEWEGMLDLADIWNYMMEQTYGVDMAKYMELESFDVRVTFTFEKNGKYHLSANERDLESAMEDAADVFIDVYYEIIDLAIQNSGLNMTADEYAEEKLGCTIEEYVSSVMVVDTSSLEQSGNYELDGNKLYVDEEGEYYIIALDGDELKFTDYKGGTEMATEINSLIFDDVVFERQ